jgi:hypothetical protein
MAINFLNNGNFPDNAELTFGNSDDLKLYHDGSNSYVQDSGTGDLFIKGSNDIYIQFTNNEYAAEFSENSSVDLYHNGTRVFSTGSTGITVQGDSNDITFVNDSSTDHNYLKVFVPDTTVNALGVSQTNVYIPIDLRVDGVTTFNGSASVNADNIKLKIGAGSDLELYHNGTNSFIENATGDLYVDSNGDDLYLQSDDDVIIRSQGSENAIYCTGNAGVKLYHNASEKLETQTDGIDVTGNINFGTSDGDLEMSEGSHIVLNPMQNPGAGAEANGIIVKLHTSTTVFGKIYYKSNLAAAWSYANAGSDGTTRMLGVALGTSSSNDGMLLQGIIRIASHGLSAGAPLYVSTTNGEFTTTAPSSGGDYVRVVGYTIDSNTIYFNPSGTWVEVA